MIAAALRVAGADPAAAEALQRFQTAPDSWPFICDQLLASEPPVAAFLALSATRRLHLPPPVRPAGPAELQRVADALRAALLRRPDVRRQAAAGLAAALLLAGGVEGALAAAAELGGEEPQAALALLAAVPEEVANKEFAMRDTQRAQLRRALQAALPSVCAGLAAPDTPLAPALHCLLSWLPDGDVPELGPLGLVAFAALREGPADAPAFEPAARLAVELACRKSTAAAVAQRLAGCGGAHPRLLDALVCAVDAGAPGSPELVADLAAAASLPDPAAAVAALPALGDLWRRCGAQLGPAVREAHVAPLLTLLLQRSAVPGDLAAMRPSARALLTDYRSAVRQALRALCTPQDALALCRAAAAAPGDETLLHGLSAVVRLLPSSDSSLAAVVDAMPGLLGERLAARACATLVGVLPPQWLAAHPASLARAAEFAVATLALREADPVLPFRVSDESTDHAGAVALLKLCRQPALTEHVGVRPLCAACLGLVGGLEAHSRAVVGQALASLAAAADDAGAFAEVLAAIPAAAVVAAGLEGHVESALSASASGLVLGDPDVELLEACARRAPQWRARHAPALVEAALAHGAPELAALAAAALPSAVAAADVLRALAEAGEAAAFAQLLPVVAGVPGAAELAAGLVRQGLVADEPPVAAALLRAVPFEPAVLLLGPWPAEVVDERAKLLVSVSLDPSAGWDGQLARAIESINDPTADWKRVRRELKRLGPR